MRRPRRPHTGTGIIPFADQPGISFPATLLQPPQSQLTMSEDAVGDRIRRLDARAEELGRGFGIPFTSFILNPPTPLKMDTTLRAVTYMLQEFIQRNERITLERRNGRWGLYFTREPALLDKDRAAETVLLRDAPLDVRERFLVRSEAFFRGYLALCEARLGSMNASVTSADKTLALLDNVELK